MAARVWVPAHMSRGHRVRGHWRVQGRRRLGTKSRNWKRITRRLGGSEAIGRAARVTMANQRLNATKVKDITGTHGRIKPRRFKPRRARRRPR